MASGDAIDTIEMDSVLSSSGGSGAEGKATHYKQHRIVGSAATGHNKITTTDDDGKHDFHNRDIASAVLVVFV